MKLNSSEGSQCNLKWDLGACHSKAIKEARLVERKVCFILDASNWGLEGRGQAPLSMGFCRQESWSGLPFPPPWGLPDSRIKAASSASPALVGWFFTMSLNTIPPCEALSMYILVLIATWKQSCILRSSQALKTNLGLNLSYYLIVLIVSKLNNLPMPRFTHL